MEYFGAFWLYFNLPVFVMIIFAKCIDLYSYRKLRMTDKMGRYLILDLLVIEVTHLLTTSAEYLIIDKWNDLLYLLFVLAPLLSISPLVILYLSERKRFNRKLTLIKRSFVVDFILTCTFRALYIILLIWYIFPLEFWGSSGNNHGLSKDDIILIVSEVLLILLFALIKIISQKKLVKRDNQIKN